MSKDSLAMALAKPHSAIWWLAWDGKLQASAVTEEEGWRAANTLLAAAGKAWWWDRPDLSAGLADDYDIVWDYPMSLKAHLADAQTNGGAGIGDLIAGPYAAYDLARMHDFAAAEEYLSASNPDDKFTKSVMLWETGVAALERGDTPAAITALEASRRWVEDVMKFDLSTVDFACQLGQAYSQAGRLPDALAIFDVGKDLSLCVALKGQALARSGNVAAAKAAWAAGLAAAPDLPPIYYYRGLTEAATGDADGAVGDFRTAHAKAPHWAEPLKAWGDLLSKQNQLKAAQDKYDEALEYAPHWVDLQRARAEAVTRSSSDR
jgi:tetratricopeptide (TPR) repeat protein